MSGRRQANAAPQRPSDNARDDRAHVARERERDGANNRRGDYRTRRIRAPPTKAKAAAPSSAAIGGVAHGGRPRPCCPVARRDCQTPPSQRNNTHRSMRLAADAGGMRVRRER
jgi:hypothetical protein